MPIPERFIDELKSRLNVSDVVGKRVRLERKGRASGLLSVSQGKDAKLHSK